MKRHINNPYTVNWKIYGLIGGISLFIMLASAVQNHISHGLISDLIKNLSLGCVASTIVALLIEIGNVRDKNEKSNSVYDAVYNDLKMCILWYLEDWARICLIANKNHDYSKEKHTWIEWYEIVKSESLKYDDNIKVDLIVFIKEQLLFCIDAIENALKQIDNQQYILAVNNLYDQKLNSILADYSFEFEAAKSVLQEKYDINFDTDQFWNTFDAIRNDLIKYINNWSDIRYYNYLKFKPYDLHDDCTDFINAILESEISNQKA